MCGAKRASGSGRVASSVPVTETERVSVMKGLQGRVPASSCCVRSGEDERRYTSAATAETDTFSYG